MSPVTPSSVAYEFIPYANLYIYKSRALKKNCHCSLSYKPAYRTLLCMYLCKINTSGKDYLLLIFMV